MNNWDVWLDLPHYGRLYKGYKGPKLWLNYCISQEVTCLQMCGRSGTGGIQLKVVSPSKSSSPGQIIISILWFKITENHWNHHLCTTIRRYGVSINGGTQNGWFTWGNPIKMYDWGYPHQWKPPYTWYLSTFSFRWYPKGVLSRLRTPRNPPAHLIVTAAHRIIELG